MHKLELAFRFRAPGNAVTFAHHSKKIFGGGSCGMNFLRIARCIDHASNAGKWSKAVETITLIGDRERKDTIIFQKRIAIIEKADEVSGVFEDVRSDNPIIGMATSD